MPREAYVFGMEALLQAHLGGARPVAPGQRLRAYLRDNLRLAGPEFREFARQQGPKQAAE